MSKVVARGGNAVALFVVVLVGGYVVNGWLRARGLLSLVHRGGRGGWAPYVGECTVLGFDLWIPCWLAAGAPLVLLILAVGVVIGRD